jgi:serine/threonine protein kinase
MSSMQRKIDYLIKAKVRLHLDKKQLGLKKIEYIERKMASDEIKGFLFKARIIKVKIPLFIKINPLDIRYTLQDHPCNQEGYILEQLQSELFEKTTPHITRTFYIDRLSNTERCMTFIPIKPLHPLIYRESNIIVSEYVSGGSLTDYMVDKCLSLKQWKYIIFGVIWTLAVLQDKYKFVHSDLHSSNVLLEVCTPSETKYCWQDENNQMEFYIKCDIFPKIWDFEFATMYDAPEEIHDLIEKPNPFALGQKCLPQKFDPYYDIHEFLMSVKELNCPMEIREFILSLYPDDLIAMTPTSSISSFESREEDEISVQSFISDFYYTDEDLTELDEYFYDKFSEKDEDEPEEDYYSDASSKPRSDQRTEFIIEGRLRNDIVSQKFPNELIPTPFLLLSHPFFEEFRQPTKKSSVVFTYRAQKTECV